MSYDLIVYAPGSRELPVSWEGVKAELRRQHADILPACNEAAVTVRRGKQHFAKVSYREPTPLEELTPEEADTPEMGAHITVDLPAWADACAMEFAFEVAIGLADAMGLAVSDPQIGLDPVRRDDLRAVQQGFKRYLGDVSELTDELDSKLETLHAVRPTRREDRGEPTFVLKPWEKHTSPECAAHLLSEETIEALDYWYTWTEELNSDDFAPEDEGAPSRKDTHFWLVSNWIALWAGWAGFSAARSLEASRVYYAFAHAFPGVSTPESIYRLDMENGGPAEEDIQVLKEGMEAFHAVRAQMYRARAVESTGRRAAATHQEPPAWTKGAAQRWLEWLDRTLSLTRRRRELAQSCKYWKIVEGQECPGIVVGQAAEGLAPSTARNRFHSDAVTHEIYTEEKDYWTVHGAFKAHLHGWAQVTHEMYEFCPSLYEMLDRPIRRIDILISTAEEAEDLGKLASCKHFMSSLGELREQLGELAAIGTSPERSEGPTAVAPNVAHLIEAVRRGARTPAGGQAGQAGHEATGEDTGAKDEKCSGPYYLRFWTRETEFHPDALPALQEQVLRDDAWYFYRVEDGRLAQRLVRLFDRRFRSHLTDGSIRHLTVEGGFSCEPGSKMNEEDRFLIEEDIERIATEVADYIADWQRDYFEAFCMNGAVMGSGPLPEPPQYKEDAPLSAPSLYDQARRWEKKLMPKEPEPDAIQAFGRSASEGKPEKGMPREKADQPEPAAKLLAQPDRTEKADQEAIDQLSEDHKRILLAHQEAEEAGLKPPTFRALARSIGVSHETVRRWCKEIELATGAPLPGRDKNGARRESSVPPGDLDNREAPG